MEHIYHSKDKDLIQQYMEKVTWIFIEYFVIEAAGSYKLSDEGIPVSYTHLHCVRFWKQWSIIGTVRFR